MKKNIIIAITILLFVSIFFAGCIDESKSTDEKSNLPDNLSPVGLISAPEEGYFGVTIEFSASDSYDSDGEIVSYNWDFGDDETAEGTIVKHVYRFENNFDIEYPLIYPIYMFVKDNYGSITATSHQIKIYPGEYIFYLNSQKLTTEKPASSMDTIMGSGLFKLRSPQEFTYELDKPITVQKCAWNVTVYLEKPLFILANKLSIIFYNNEGNEIIKKDEKIGPSSLWKEKTVQIKGIFDKEEEFETLKIVIYGFSLRKKINILYGGEEASRICFNFATWYH